MVTRFLFIVLSCVDSTVVMLMCFSMRLDAVNIHLAAMQFDSKTFSSLHSPKLYVNVTLLYDDESHETP